MAVEIDSKPRVGMPAIVRGKRKGVITSVDDFPGEHGTTHLVNIDYNDDLVPRSDTIIWELESSPRLLPATDLPNPAHREMPPEDFDALIRAARWTAIQPYLDPDGKGPLDRLPATSPFHGAIEVEDFQMVPLLKALRMPRVNLMIADDVGLGKTIEAGLILSELLIRRRINRVLILTPASLRIQWQDEMQEKFSLPFEIVDRDSTMRLKRRLGIDANPWRLDNRIISSYHYLRQPDVLQQFLSASALKEGSAKLPWDLLIVDEVHNLMPSAMGEDSQLCKALREIVPLFEHRLFLTATPHNGYTRSFTGLLEMLDPVRFSQKDELTRPERDRIQQIVVRRLKGEINARTNPPRFCTRKPPEAIKLDDGLDPRELALIRAFEAFRLRVRSVIAGAAGLRRKAGTFAVEILGKRMLSGPMTFLDSWQRCRMGMAGEDLADDRAVVAAGKSVEEESVDDREAEERTNTASTVIGSWLHSFVDRIHDEIDAIDSAALNLGVDLTQTVIQQNPMHDARFEALVIRIEELLRHDGSWRDDERLIIFTEYKTTLDYLIRRLRHHYSDDETAIRMLFGGMDDTSRELIKEAFNDPDDKVRILVATDAAAEGLNLQSTARYLLHYDCPWNPSKLEQRNGRLDRHGQARDVQIFHFASEQASDIKFLSYLIHKVDQIREDLGATGDLFDRMMQRKLIDGEDESLVSGDLERGIELLRDTTSIDADDDISPTETAEEFTQDLEALRSEMDYAPAPAAELLDAAMSMRGGRPQLSHPDGQGRFDLLHPDLAGWKDMIDETIRKQTRRNQLGPIPKLTFNPEPFQVDIGGRTVFRPSVNTKLLHLGHPLVRKAIGTLNRRRFDLQNAVSRWTVRYGAVPAGAEALLILYLEEMAVNELRETFHHWITTVRLPVINGELGDPLDHEPPATLNQTTPCRDHESVESARDLAVDVELDLQDYIRKHRDDLTTRLQNQLDEDRERVSDEEQQRFRSRQGELSTLIEENTLGKLEKEIKKLRTQLKQGELFGSESDLDGLEQSVEQKQEELERRRLHYEELRAQLSRERKRSMELVIPRRYAMKGDAQIFPVAFEIRFPHPEGGAR
ncbi:DISARM system SNF2-like helicase DrmD [bacterium]|nr:DISARM system SNF2-like helicase DrmD [bacterium]